MLLFRVAYASMLTESRRNHINLQSVLDILAEQAEDLVPEDLSINVYHYLYGAPNNQAEERRIRNEMAIFLPF
jgi:hypothetical protein